MKALEDAKQLLGVFCIKPHPVVSHMEGIADSRVHAPAHLDHGALFVGRTGRRLTPRGVQQRLKTWALKQGISAKVHPHVLRHSFATHVLQSSGDLRAVQELLGHADISTTQVYTKLDHQHLAKVYDAAHPRARRR